MRRTALSVLASLLFAFPLAENSPGLQSLPGLHKVPSRMDIPFDPPATASRKTADPVQLEDEAAELARLSAGIPAQIQSVNRRIRPKDLDSQLKRIEKLAKHLRSQVSP